MTLLIIELDKSIGNAKEWRETFNQQLPDLPIRIWPDAGELAELDRRMAELDSGQKRLNWEQFGAQLDAAEHQGQ